MKYAEVLWQDGRLGLSRLLGSRMGAWLLAWLLGQLAVWAGIALLAVSGWFITAAGLAGMVNLASAFTFNYLFPSGVIRLLAITRTAGRYGQQLTAHGAALSLLADLRSGLFARLARMPRYPVAAVAQMHRLTSDIDLLNAWPLTIVLPACWCGMNLVLLLGLVALTTQLWLALLLAVPLLLAAVAIPLWAACFCADWGSRQNSQAEARRQALLQPLSALTALLQWQQWPRFSHAFRQKDGLFLSMQNQQQQFCDRVVLLQRWCMVPASLLLLLAGMSLVADQRLSVALLLALLLALWGSYELVLMLGQAVMNYGLCRSACQRLNALLPPVTAVTADAEKLPLPASIDLQAVHIRVRHRGALNGVEEVSFDLRCGDVLVIYGASGAGKSTLLAALAGEIPLQQGQLLCLGQPLDHWQWQGKLAYLAQQLDIFDLTLAQNLRLGKADASDDDLWQVLEKVALTDWVRAQPAGLETPLGEYGCAISGGQARRVALARLLLKQYPLMLLDEPCAGLDAATCEHIIRMLQKQQQHGILIMVSHHALPWLSGKAMMLKL